jgi:NADPH2:quinone reductase
VGLNFIDTYHRGGLYPMKMPAVLGLEAAGVVEALGEGVTRFKLGDRVAYNGTLGAYAEAAVVPADRAVKVPDGVSLETAAAVLLKGMTAEFLVRRCHKVEPGQTVLIHAAAGGVGSILVQWAKALGATVIATVGSEAKAALARDHGADHVILYGEEDVAAGWPRSPAARAWPWSMTAWARTPSRPASRAWAGAACSPPSATPRARPGHRAAGAVGSKSLFLTRPRLFDYIATTAELDESAAALFAVLAVRRGEDRGRADVPLAEARAAHEALEGRRTTGATLLIP